MGQEGYLDEVLRQLHGQKAMAEKAVAQIGDEDLFTQLDEESLSIAIIMKHMGGSMRSRWMDFLTSDGEKPDRNRDSEFLIEDVRTRDQVMERWEAGWRCFFDALEPLTTHDLDRTVHIRSEPLTVLQAIQRGFNHSAYHVGQIVFLAKHFAKGNWQSLSIPPGKSEEFWAAMRAKHGQSAT